ncbi:hypothetical protein SKAU_G00299490 [Synaphobranchus kaupii]|uniref:Uncharacterized protein n=1 Tax=Synaphobranchus kaupii TaxID=118154 RepID=A0A9Q1EV98_SYNKA|nr:hypothetical protein SKAU_G00299490 [Synaphobranchus kaupii]
MQCSYEDPGFFPAELQVETKKLVSRIMEETGAELIHLGRATARRSPTRDVGSMLTEGAPRPPKSGGSGVGMPDPDTTVYMEDPEDEGSCVGVRIWGFSEILIRQVTQLLLESRRCGTEPLMDLDAAKDYHVELLYKFVEQVVKNLLENITHLNQDSPTVEAELEAKKEPSVRLRPSETALDAPRGLPTVEEEPGVAPSDESIPQVRLVSELTGAEKVRPGSEQKPPKSPFRLTQMFANSVAPLVLEDSLDGSASLSAIDKPKRNCSSLTAALSGLFCFSCSTDIHQ